MREEQILELWNERAAIMEFEANMTRTQAERAAYYDLRKVLGRFVVPDVIREKLKLGEK